MQRRSYRGPVGGGSTDWDLVGGAGAVGSKLAGCREGEGRRSESAATIPTPPAPSAVCQSSGPCLGVGTGLLHTDGQDHGQSGGEWGRNWPSTLHVRLNSPPCEHILSTNNWPELEI